jgi:uncharacterized membrane protein YsdA (DUF1294 family)/cold shock CspA family protein
MTRVQANLVEWKDDKGYGFARLPGGTSRVFVHAKSLQAGVQRPKKGDVIELELIEGRKGPAAQHVRVLSEIEVAHRLPYHVVTASMLFILAQLVVIIGKAPFGLVVFYTLMGAISIYLYGRDKQAAIAGLWRISEAHLLAIDLFGGIIGGLLAQQRYWHKTSKERYQTWVYAIVVLHAGLLAALGSGILIWPH